MSKTVEEMMTRVLFAVSPENTVAVAEAAMRQGNVRHLLVVDDKWNLLGVVSDKDMVTAGPDAAVSAIMSDKPVTITATAPAYEAVALMLQHRFNALPVLDDNEKLTGIITSTDVMIAAYDALSAVENAPESRPVEVDEALLSAKVGHVRDAMSAAGLASAIAELASFLKQRFVRQDQPGGIFAQLVDEAPGRKAEIDALRASHEAILATAYEMIDENWARARNEDVMASGVPELVQAVQNHDQKEAELLERELAAAEE